MFRQVSSKSASKTDLSVSNIVKLFNLSAVNNSTMTLIEQREAMLYDALVYSNLSSDEVNQAPSELLPGSTLAYRKANLCAK